MDDHHIVPIYQSFQSLRLQRRRQSIPMQEYVSYINNIKNELHYFMLKYKH